MKLKLFTRTSFCLAALLLAGCSEAPKQAETPKEPPKPPEAVSGLTGLYEMYKPARNWAKDLETLKLTSAVLKRCQSQAWTGRRLAGDVRIGIPASGPLLRLYDR